MPIESILFASHCVKFFINMSSLTPPSNPGEVGRSGVVLSLFHGWKTKAQRS